MLRPTVFVLACAAILALAAFPSHAQDAAAGEVVYHEYCSQCHGDDGAADGPAAHFVLPRPRVFEGNSSYKFRTTPSGELPTEQDLFNIITLGIPGTSMPGFDALSEKQRWDVVAHIRSLSEDFQDPDFLATAVPMPELVDPPPRPDPDAESLEKGAVLYQENKCWQCHGQRGRGNGESWPTLSDDWGNQILPANLANPEHFRGGHEPFDIYRTMSTGLNGTPMPGYSDSITPEDRWHMVNYVQSLGPAAVGQKGEVIIASLVEALPAGPDDAAWEGLPEARFPTISNIIEPPRLFWPSVEFLMVRAAYTETEIALRIQWDDRSESKGTDTEGSYADRDGAIYQDTDHPDQLAVQFPIKTADVKKRPYLLFGDGKRPAMLWWWRGDTGEATEITGKGFGTFKDSSSGELTSQLSYEDGRYSLVLRRALLASDPTKDVGFSADTFLPVAFHVWDGGRGEVGQRRALTSWYWLYLEPSVPKGTLFAKAGGAAVLTLVLLVGISGWVRRREA